MQLKVVVTNDAAFTDVHKHKQSNTRDTEPINMNNIIFQNDNESKKENNSYECCQIHSVMGTAGESRLGESGLFSSII